ISGEVASWQPFESQSPGRRARSWVRFLHTGEALGIVGQTIAGLVSLTTLVMVWTGLALAYRRLISPLFRSRAQR
ncbi:MAG: PepSY domain-containing protein, partial [Gammaproteobacteria bacterium]